MMKMPNHLQGAAWACAGLLVACSPLMAEASPLRAKCAAAIGDDEDIARVLLSDTVTVADVCGCYSRSVPADPEQSVDVHAAALDAIFSAREAHDLGTEAAAKSVGAEIAADATSHGFTEDELDGVGGYITDIAYQFDDGGTCEVDG